MMQKALLRSESKVYGGHLLSGSWCFCFYTMFFSRFIYNGEYGFGGAVSHEYGLMETLKNAFYIVTTMSHGEQLLGGFWFLKSLFWGALFFYFATKIVLYIRDKKNTFVILLSGKTQKAIKILLEAQ